MYFKIILIDWWLTGDWLNKAKTNDQENLLCLFLDLMLPLEQAKPLLWWHVHLAAHISTTFWWVMQFMWRVSPVLLRRDSERSRTSAVIFFSYCWPLLPVRTRFGADDNQQDTKIHVPAPGHSRDFIQGLIPRNRQSVFSISFRQAPQTKYL